MSIQNAEIKVNFGNKTQLESNVIINMTTMTYLNSISSTACIVCRIPIKTEKCLGFVHGTEVNVPSESTHHLCIPQIANVQKKCKLCT